MNCSICNQAIALDDPVMCWRRTRRRLQRDHMLCFYIVEFGVRDDQFFLEAVSAHVLLGGWMLSDGYA